MDAPERIWLDPELVDSPRKTLACNFATATKEHSLPTDVQYVRADLLSDLEAMVTRSVELLGDAYYRERTQAAQLQEAREALKWISCKATNASVWNDPHDLMKDLVRIADEADAFLAKVGN
jgi:hypothetical protein